MKRKDCLTSLVLFVVALIVFTQTRRFTGWGEYGAGAGYFPCILSIVLGALSAIIFIQALVRSKETDETQGVLGPKKIKLFSYSASFIFFGFLLPKVGYSLVTAAFLIFIIRFVERQSWKITLMVTAFSVICSHIAFVKLLKVILPEGFLTPVIDLLGGVTD